MVFKKLKSIPFNVFMPSESLQMYIVENFSITITIRSTQITHL